MNYFKKMIRMQNVTPVQLTLRPFADFPRFVVVKDQLPGLSAKERYSRNWSV
jgi:hypothetical protein